MTKEDSLEKSKFKGIGQLLIEDWKIYCSNIKTLLGIMALPVGFSLLLALISIFPIKTLGLGYWIYVTLFLISFFLNLLVIPVLLYNLKENTGFRESYQRGLKIFKSYLWVYFLVFIITAAGFLFFIIPGILFSIWFSLTSYVLIFEEKKGINALKRSKELISDRWWGIFGRFLIFVLIIIIITIVILVSISFSIRGLMSGGEIDSINNIIVDLLKLFIIPVFLIYGSLIYKNLAEIKKETFPKKPFQKRKHILLRILGLLIFAIIFVFAFLNIFLGKDDRSSDDSDLWLPKIQIQKEENAYYQLNKLQEEIYWPEEKVELIDDILQGEKWDVGFVEELLKNNEENFDYFEKALAYPKFQLPELQDLETVPFNIAVPSFYKYRQLAKLKAIRSLYLFNQDQQKKAFEEAIKIIKFGNLIEDSPRPILIQYLVGIIIKEIGLKTLRGMIQNTTLSPNVLKNYLEDLNNYKTNKEGLVTILKAEYMTLTKPLDNFAKSNLYLLEELMGKVPFHVKLMIKLKFYFKPNQTKELFAEHYRNEITNLNKNYYNEIEEYIILPLIPYSLGRRLLTENLIGKILYDVTVVNIVPAIFEKKCQSDFSLIGTQLLMVIKSYQIENGKIPTSLDELVPEYILEIPEDPFDGKPIRFSPEKKLIYSVGSDLKDFGGSEGEDWTKMEDPTFEIKF